MVTIIRRGIGKVTSIQRGLTYLTRHEDYCFNPTRHKNQNNFRHNYATKDNCYQNWAFLMPQKIVFTIMLDMTEEGHS